MSKGKEEFGLISIEHFAEIIGVPVDQCKKVLENLYTPQNYAEVWGVKRQTVHHHIKEKHIKAIQLENVHCRLVVDCDHNNWYFSHINSGVKLDFKNK